MLTIYRDLSTENTRVPKPDVTALEDWYKTATLEEKEARALDFIETAMRHVGLDKKFVVSCSFGVDSIVTLHLVRRVAEKLGVHVDVVWNNTLNEFPQTRKYAKELTEAWGLRLIEARPETTLRQIYEKHGVDSLFKRKGDRSAGQPVVEKCCGALKHDPMKRTIREHKWDLMFNGVRAGETRQRWMSARRDCDLYYSKSEWKTFTARPILWWTSNVDSFNYGNNRQEDVWEYVRKYNLPYNSLYDMNVVIDDRYEVPNQVVDRESAEDLVEQGYNVFMPRTGCQACPIPIRRGYLRYLRELFPNTYRSMLFQLGFAKVLLAELPDDQQRAVFAEMQALGVVENEDEMIERLERVLEFRPCLFDGVGVDKRKKAKAS